MQESTGEKGFVPVQDAECDELSSYRSRIGFWGFLIRIGVGHTLKPYSIY